MQGILKGAVLAGTVTFGCVVGAPGPAAAMGIIEKACVGSERGSAAAVLCTCIQQVADQVLAPSDQHKGAALFDDPHKSQELRQSPDENDESFWLKWKEYGAAAERYCS
ncbi:hypothetical protein [Maritimibacter sp. DP1N21-5]|uniref:hypothetical protein n=1 Tax=Maritimibacter sp. DP1N21-5 TaxID=2836867 RepID=UPI001C444863|nr:hypothetical protein [Maritimibacter sp. DP1N21-5]MBV7408019.1 hypothetical protein [Maritimibacter sp. DP1N21-5]